MGIDVETSLLWRLNGIQELTDFWILGIFMVLIAANALGIGAASFASDFGNEVRGRERGH